MKTTKYKTLSSIVLFVALWMTQTALAWYDPSTQRWLTRDPIGELGFQTVQANTSSGPWINRDSIDMSESEPDNLYTFVHNKGVNKFDPLGLSDSDASYKAMLDLLKAMKKAMDNLPDNPRGCMSPCTGATSLRAICDCIWGAMQKMKNNPAQIEKAADDAAQCICQASSDSQCFGKWKRRAKIIFESPKDSVQ